jgi:hypothetical protein
MIVTDPDTGELVGPASEVEALLDDAEVSRSPAFRAWTEGGARRVTLVGNATAAVLVTDRPGGRRALLPAPTAHAIVALVVWLDLRPRPVPAHAPVRLAPGALAVVIGRGEVHGHGLEPDVANDLQQRLDAGVRHWALRVEWAEGRRNLEVVDGPGGIWRVRPAGGQVELAPTSSTEVARELIALVWRASRSAAP